MPKPRLGGFVGATIGLAFGLYLANGITRHGWFEGMLFDRSKPVNYNRLLFMPDRLDPRSSLGEAVYYPICVLAGLIIGSGIGAGVSDYRRRNRPDSKYEDGVEK